MASKAKMFKSFIDSYVSERKMQNNLKGMGLIGSGGANNTNNSFNNEISGTIGNNTNNDSIIAN